jgi:hypothetical protein
VAKEAITLLKEIIHTYKKQVKFIRCDNAGENKTFKKQCIAEKLGIEFEYTAPNTPQQNGVAERKFATLFGRSRAMMNQAGFTKQKREELWTEAANTATDLANITLGTGKSTPPYTSFYAKDAPYAAHLRTFGEMGVTLQPNVKTLKKSEARGRICIFLGYASKHAANVGVGTGYWLPGRTGTGPIRLAHPVLGFPESGSPGTGYPVSLCDLVTPVQGWTG